MTIDSTYLPLTIPVNEPRTYNFNFQNIGTETVYVFEVDSQGEETPASNINVTLGGNAPVYTGGTVVFNDPHTAGTVEVKIYRNTPESQLVDFQPYGPFPAEDNEFALDKLTLILQEEISGSGAGGTGDISGAQNLAGGTGEVYSSEASGILYFRTLVGGNDIDISTSGNTVTIDSTASGGGGGAYLPLDGSDPMTGSITMGPGAFSVRFDEGYGSGLVWGVDPATNASIGRTLDGGGNTQLTLNENGTNGEAIDLVVGDSPLYTARWRVVNTGESGIAACQTNAIGFIEWVDFSEDPNELYGQVGVDGSGDLRVQNPRADSRTIINAGGGPGPSLTLDDLNNRIQSNQNFYFSIANTGLTWPSASLKADGSGIATLAGVVAQLQGGTAFVKANALDNRMKVEGAGADFSCNIAMGNGQHIDFATNGRVRWGSSGSEGAVYQSTDAIRTSVNGTEQFAVRSTGQMWARTKNSDDDNTLITRGWYYVAESSDSRIKENVTPIASGIAVIDQLSPVTFDFKQDSDAYKAGRTQNTAGFIAQELQSVLPNMVYEQGDEDKTLRLAKEDIVPYLVKAVQELTARVAELEAQNA